MADCDWASSLAGILRIIVFILETINVIIILITEDSVGGGFRSLFAMFVIGATFAILFYLILTYVFDGAFGKMPIMEVVFLIVKGVFHLVVCGIYLDWAFNGPSTPWQLVIVGIISLIIAILMIVDFGFALSEMV